MPLPKLSWFLIGQSFFGVLIGFMVGLSISPVVSTVLGLMFAFIGGSLFVLIKGRSEDELAFIGKSITALSLFIMLGVVIGIITRTNDVLEPDDTQHPPYNFSERLSLDDIIALSNNKENGNGNGKGKGKEIDPSLICSVIKSTKVKGKPTEITKNQLMDLMQQGVNAKVIYALIGDDSECFGKSFMKIKPSSRQGQGGYLYIDKAPNNDWQDD